MSEPRPLPTAALPPPPPSPSSPPPSSPSAPRPPGADLQVRSGADGSFSLWSPDVREGFHSGRGAVREAQETFVRPSQLERFQAGERLTLLLLTLCLTLCSLGGCTSNLLRSRRGPREVLF